MNNRRRLLAVAAALAVLAVAIVVIPSRDSDTEPTAAVPATPETPTAATEATGPAEKPPQRKRVKPPLLTAAEPKELTFKRGDLIRFSARNDSADEIHVHGYDKSKPLPADKTVTMRFEADIEGIFEIELEQSGQPIGTLKVVPR